MANARLEGIGRGGWAARPPEKPGHMDGAASTNPKDDVGVVYDRRNYSSGRHRRSGQLVACVNPSRQASADCRYISKMEVRGGSGGRPYRPHNTSSYWGGKVPVALLQGWRRGGGVA
jgi:hypothetical protein